MVAKGNGKRNPAVCYGAQNFQGAGNIRAAEENVSGVYNQVRLNSVKGVLNAAQGPFSGDLLLYNAYPLTAAA